ncbi:hydroxyacid dehydrogenase [Ereboglobus luteus]|uniref:Phosphoglycerate dehydrogenase n=1 Tax=Ereboglobus luteus TaxID=1796921 RepID=A0A2U8DZU6_9BACT|nr:hydroxyacid dehydrogenase [Ereboglobus luteus]AWI08123.1 phosphoglycerate dehydrogenase [Ereboglobus luteus]
MKPKIGVIIHKPLREDLFDEASWRRLHEIGDVTATGAMEPVSVAEAADVLRGCDIAVGSWWAPAPSAALFSAAPNLRFWEHVGGSVKHFFAEDWGGHELTVASCKGAIAECVAEMVVGELIVGLRRIIPNARANRRGPAERPAGMKVLSACRVGVIGASEVGKLVMEYLRPFGCAIDLYDPYIKPDEAEERGARLVRDLMELCQNADAVTLHTPVLPSTHGLLGEKHFKAMRDDTVFINTSRGECIDENALIRELEKERLWAFLDVSNPEPAAADSPLRALPNVYYTSHLAGPATYNMGRRAVADIEAFLSGKPPQCVVTRDMLERIA